MKNLKKPKFCCPYCESSWIWPHVPAKADCPECGITIDYWDIQVIGYDIDCKGAKWDRTKHKFQQSKRERAFYLEWKDEHRFSDFLQMLFRDEDEIDEISNRERYIVNTIIQWLGTNVGFCLVERALKRAGYKIKKVEG